MKIVIVGAGDVGFHLAKLLAEEAQDIYLVDRDRDKLDYAAAHTDVYPVRGNGTRIAVLKEAQAGRADLLIAVTDKEDTNMVSAMIGKKLGARRTIARVQNLELLHRTGDVDMRELGIDSLISPRELLVREIQRLVDQSAATDVFEFADGVLSMMGIVLRPTSPLAGRSVVDSSDLNPGFDFLPIAVHRGNETIIPRGATVFRPGDHVYFLTKPEGANAIAALSGAPQQRFRQVMVIGGGFTGELTAQSLQRTYRVKLVEKNRERAGQLADELPDTLVIHADARDVEALEEESIEDVDVFVALTGDSETNIISCLVAKNHGVVKTIALVENIDYIYISQNIGIDALINRKLIAANDIFRHVRQGDISAIVGFHGVNAEVIEFVVGPKARVTRKPIRELDFPRQALIGGVIRDGEAHIIGGDFQIRPGDHVVVFCLPEAIHATERLFH